jgi:hypothetical protein
LETINGKFLDWKLFSTFVEQLDVLVTGIFFTSLLMLHFFLLLVFFPSVEYFVSYLIPACPVYAPQKPALDPERQWVGIETDFKENLYP